MSALLYPKPNFMVLNFRFRDFLNIRFFNSSVFKGFFFRTFHRNTYPVPTQYPRRRPESRKPVR